METPATTFALVSKFRFGADVRDAEGQGGSLAHVVVAAEGAAIRAVGVKFGLFGRVVYTPVERVAAASDAGIALSATRAEIEKDGKQPAGVRLGDDTAVTLNGKRLGKLAQVSFDGGAHTLRHLVVERGLGNEAIVSASAVTQINASGVGLGATRDGAAVTLTPYRPDADLRDDAHRAIESYSRLRVDMDGVNVTATDGVIWLRGHVSSELNRRLIENLVSGVPGLAELHNELIPDPELAAEISHRLARDPRTAEDRIGVYPKLGRVHLRGGVRTAIAREAAEALTQATPGVVEIINELRVDPNANVLPVMASVTNEEDIVPGGR